MIIEDALNGKDFDRNDLRIQLFLFLASMPSTGPVTLDQICARFPDQPKNKIRGAFSIMYRLELVMFDFQSMSYRIRESRNSVRLREILYSKQQL
jgi:hypothetical protein